MNTITLGGAGVAAPDSIVVLLDDLPDRRGLIERFLDRWNGRQYNVVALPFAGWPPEQLAIDLANAINRLARKHRWPKVASYDGLVVTLHDIAEVNVTGKYREPTLH